MSVTDVTSRADVIRNSLRLYEWLVDRARDGKYMILVDDASRDGAIDLRLVTGALPSAASPPGPSERELAAPSAPKSDSR